MEFFEKLRSGYYNAKSENPPESVWEAARNRPLLRKLPEKMTAEELASLPAVKAEYDEVKRVHEEYWEKVKKEQARLEDEFARDLHAYYGVPPSHPLVQRLYSLAWQYGHSAGYSEVDGYFSELSELYFIAVKNGMKKEG